MSTFVTREAPDNWNAPLAAASTRYTSAAELGAAIRAAAAEAPEGSDECRRQYGTGDDWHGPTRPPSAVVFCYAIAGTRGQYTVANTRARLLAFADTVHAVRAAFDGKVRSGPRKRNAPAGSAVAAIRDAWQQGDYAAALSAAEGCGGLWFGKTDDGDKPRPFIRPEHIEAGGIAFVIAKCLVTGRVTVSHADSGLRVSGASGSGIRFAEPRSYSAARSLIEEWTTQTAENGYLSCLLAAAARAAPFCQRAALVAVAGAQSTAAEAAQVEEVPTAQPVAGNALAPIPAARARLSDETPADVAWRAELAGRNAPPEMVPAGRVGSVYRAHCRTYAAARALRGWAPYAPGVHFRQDGSDTGFRLRGADRLRNGQSLRDDTARAMRAERRAGAQCRPAPLTPDYAIPAAAPLTAQSAAARCRAAAPLTAECDRRREPAIHWPDFAKSCQRVRQTAAKPHPGLRIPPGDLRRRIPPSFAPVYMLRA